VLDDLTPREVRAVHSVRAVTPECEAMTNATVRSMDWLSPGPSDRLEHVSTVRGLPDLAGRHRGANTRPRWMAPDESQCYEECSKHPDCNGFRSPGQLLLAEGRRRAAIPLSIAQFQSAGCEDAEVLKELISDQAP
jgi:hypothetical protein